MDGLFTTENSFKDTFLQGLDKQVAGEQLGNFILAMANATLDVGIYNGLQERLRKRFDVLAEQHAELSLLEDSRTLTDDEDVFLRMMQSGYTRLKVSEYRQLDGWWIQFNMLRSFRPARMSRTVISDLRLPFDPEGFHFNRPFLQQERLWEGEAAGISVSLYYNKYPFVPFHLLLVPDRLQQREQYLDKVMFFAMQHWFSQVLKVLPSAVMGFNARGAFASVNHLHFQLGIPQEPLQVESPAWRHNGGEKQYPSHCCRFDDADRAWQMIHYLHQQNQPYNLLWTRHALYCFPRRFQGDYQSADWAGGFSWYELAGGVIINNREMFLSLTTQQLEDSIRAGEKRLACQS